MKIFFTAFLFSFFFFCATGQVYKTLQVQDMQADINILQSAWTNLHPGIYRYNTPAQLQSYFEVLKKKCSAPLDERKFYILLSQLAEKIKCGHTFLNPLNLDDETQKRFLPQQVIPVFFVIDGNKKMIVTHNLSGNPEIKTGDEIVSVNGIKVAAIVDSLLTVSRSDGKNAVGKKLNNIHETPDEAASHSLFDIYFPFFFPQNATEFVVNVRHYQTKKIKQFRLTPLSFTQRIEAYEKQFGKVPAAEKTWYYKIINEQTAYAKFGTFSFWNSSFQTKKYVDSIFGNLPAGVKNLIVDIRQNEGGDNTGDYILSYLTSKKIGCDDADRRCFRYLHIADSLLPYLSTWDNSFKKPKDASNFFINDIGLYELKKQADDCNAIMPKPNAFKGIVFLLTNAKNSSAGYEMARDFKTAKLGKIIGETTGGSQQGINGSEFFFLKLPNSKFEIDLPLVYQYHANKPDKGIDPDYLVPTTQKDIAEGRDPQLQFVLQLIQKQTK